MRLAMIAVLALAAAACTRQHQLASLPSGKFVNVETTDGAVVEATVVPHASGIVLADRIGRIVPTERVSRVVDVRRGRGAIDGALLVGLSGVAFGAAMGLASGDDRCESFCILTFTGEEKAALLGTMFGAMGVATGAIIGSIVGSRDVYVLGDSRELRITPNGPRGSVAGMSFQF